MRACLLLCLTLLGGCSHFSQLTHRPIDVAPKPAPSLASPQPRAFQQSEVAETREDRVGPLTITGETWEKLLQNIAAEVDITTPPAPLIELYKPCQVAGPDTVILVSGDSLPDHFGPSIRAGKGLYVTLPSSPDTLDFVVFEYRCAFMQTKPEELVLERDGLFIVYSVPRYSPRQHMLYSRTGERTSPVIWDSIRDSFTTEWERERLLRSNRWPARLTDLVVARRIAIGMTAEMVKEAWGEPQAVHRTTTVRGTDEQWVYGLRRYVYLSQGQVTTIQS